MREGTAHRGVDRSNDEKLVLGDALVDVPCMLASQAREGHATPSSWGHTKHKTHPEVRTERSALCTASTALPGARGTHCTPASAAPPRPPGPRALGHLVHADHRAP